MHQPVQRGLVVVGIGVGAQSLDRLGRAVHQQRAAIGPHQRVGAAQPLGGRAGGDEAQAAAASIGVIAVLDVDAQQGEVGAHEVLLRGQPRAPTPTPGVRTDGSWASGWRASMVSRRTRYSTEGR